MAIGYVPDSFGQTAQLPQMLAQFGIGRCVFGRGLWEGVSPDTEFLWESPDGSRVTTAVLLSGYSGVKGMPEEADKAQRRIAQINSHANFMKPFNTSANTLVMGGNDQQPWDPELPGMLEAENARQTEVQYRLSGMDEFFEALRGDADLKTVQGEMLAGKYGRIHRGIWSTRNDIKKANSDAERQLTHSLEPVLTVAWALGMGYPHGMLESCWKKLFKSHAHDSIGCCNSDEVNRVVKQRLIEAAQSCRQQLELSMRRIAQRVRPSGIGELLLVFNPLPEIRNEPMTVEVIVGHESASRISLCDAIGREYIFQSLNVSAVRLSSLVQDLDAALAPGESGDPLLYRHRLLVDAGELPALGYKTLYLRSLDQDSGEERGSAEMAGADAIENEHLRVRVTGDGTLCITDLASRREMGGLFELVDGGDDGDSYDFSPPRNDWLISTRGQAPRISVEKGPLQSAMVLQFEMQLPTDLEERQSRQASIPMPVTVNLVLRRGQEYLDVEIELDNAVRDHRLQAVFRTDLETDVTYADQPFGMIERPSRPVELDEWESAGWTSKPLPLYPMQSYVAMTDGAVCLGVMTDGIREYEVDSNDPGTLAITLFRCVGRLGKPDLVYRPGRLSGMPVATPDAQLPGRLSCRFAVKLFDGPPEAMAKTARRYLSRPESFHLSGYDRFSINRGPVDLPETFSLARLRGPLVVSAVKKAEERDAFLIRAFNPSLRPVEDVQLEIAGGDGEVLEGGRLPGVVQSQQIVNFVLETAGIS
jgi:mannosylglycerate hydrolase